ncbi:ImmA/IrrE family metallo-endopeptidase [Cryptosporangium arvum]
MRDYRDIAELARRAREALRIDPGVPAPYLTYELERAGIAVVVRGRRPSDDPDAWDTDAAFSEKHLGYSIWVGDHRDRPAIVARALDSWERTRWTLAHELGHLVLHTDASAEFVEDEASLFASEFLAPLDVIRFELPKVLTLSGLIPIKLKWGISLYALLRHLLRADLVSEDRYKSMTDQLHVRKNPDTGRTWRRDEPGWDARDPERPALIRTWLERCIGTSDPNALQLMSERWPADFFEEVLATQRATARRVSPVPLKQPAPTSAPVVNLMDRRRRASG